MTIPSDEINKTIEPDESRATASTLKTQNHTLPTLHSNCRVCSSGLVELIHQLRPQYTLRELSDVLKKEHGVDLTKDALHRHFLRYRDDVDAESNRLLYENFEAVVDEVADHKQKILFLADRSFDHIIKRLDAGTLILGIGEFLDLVKVYHSVLKNPQSPVNQNLIQIFERVSQRDFKCSIKQLPLDMESEPPSGGLGGE